MPSISAKSAVPTAGSKPESRLASSITPSASNRPGTTFCIQKHLLFYIARPVLKATLQIKYLSETHLCQFCGSFFTAITALAVNIYWLLFIVARHALFKILCQYIHVLCLR